MSSSSIAQTQNSPVLLPRVLQRASASASSGYAVGADAQQPQSEDDSQNEDAQNDESGDSQTTIPPPPLSPPLLPPMLPKPEDDSQDDDSQDDDSQDDDSHHHDSDHVHDDSQSDDAQTITPPPPLSPPPLPPTLPIPPMPPPEHLPVPADVVSVSPYPPTATEGAPLQRPPSAPLPHPARQLISKFQTAGVDKTAHYWRSVFAPPKDVEVNTISKHLNEALYVEEGRGCAYVGNYARSDVAVLARQLVGEFRSAGLLVGSYCSGSELRDDNEDTGAFRKFFGDEEGSEMGRILQKLAVAADALVEDQAGEEGSSIFVNAEMGVNFDQDKDASGAGGEEGGQGGEQEVRDEEAGCEENREATTTSVSTAGSSLPPSRGWRWGSPEQVRICSRHRKARTIANLACSDGHWTCRRGHECQ